MRTAAGIPVEAVIVDAGSIPAFLRIAEMAAHLRELGMSDRAIAQALNVSDKTVAKAIDATRCDFG
jgi:predicted transcriptional regulator